MTFLWLLIWEVQRYLLQQEVVIKVLKPERVKSSCPKEVYTNFYKNIRTPLSFYCTESGSGFSEGMNYLRQNNMIHPDLKTANLPLDARDIRALYAELHATFILNCFVIMLRRVSFFLLRSAFDSVS